MQRCGLKNVESHLELQCPKVIRESKPKLRSCELTDFKDKGITNWIPLFSEIDDCIYNLSADMIKHNRLILLQILLIEP